MTRTPTTASLRKRETFHGWVDDPGAVARVVSELRNPTFAQAAPDLLADSEQREEWLFFESFQKITGNEVLANDQDGVGSCVGEGWAKGVTYLIVNRIASGKNEQIPDDLSRFRDNYASVASIYGASRVEIGGGRVNGDGSVGAWAAKAVQTMGVLWRRQYDSHDLRNWNANQVRAWGNRGVPDEIEPKMREHIVGEVTLCRTWEEYRAACINGYPVPICSNQGFTMSRDSEGFCLPRGTWAHCMIGAGAGIAKGNKPFGLIQNSWGNSPTGNKRLVLESGREVLLPQGCFAVDAEVIDRMVRQGDSFAMSDVVGFPRRKHRYDLFP